MTDKDTLLEMLIRSFPGAYIRDEPRTETIKVTKNDGKPHREVVSSADAQLQLTIHAADGYSYVFVFDENDNLKHIRANQNY